MPKRKPFDLKSPETQALRDEIVHGTFVKEGTLVAFPLCFPGCSVPIVADESHITALDVAANWMVYGGTSGRLSHLFVGMFHGATGMVLDLGAVEGANECTAMCCGKSQFVAFVNGPRGGRAICRKLQGLPFDLLQEWGFGREPYHAIGEVVPGERVVHAVPTADRLLAVGVTEHHLFTVDIEECKVDVIAKLDGAGRLAVGSKGNVFGPDKAKTLWRFDPVKKALTRKAVPLPEGSWRGTPSRWAKDPADGTLYTADAKGTLFSFTEKRGFSKPLGRTKFTPVGPMAVTLDGRLFGICGEGICRMFGLTPGGEVADIGCLVSVLERRRYGYEFGAAALGRDGQVYFGENDDLGHLWIYFPKIQKA